MCTGVNTENIRQVIFDMKKADFPTRGCVRKIRIFTTLRKIQYKRPNFSILILRNWAFFVLHKCPITGKSEISPKSVIIDINVEWYTCGKFCARDIEFIGALAKVVRWFVSNALNYVKLSRLTKNVLKHVAVVQKFADTLHNNRLDTF